MFDLTQLDRQEPGRFQIKSADGIRLYIFDFRQHHRLTRQDVEDLDQLLQDYHEALTACTAALYRVAEWSQRPIDDGGSFDDLVTDLLPGIKRALEMANIQLDETAVNPP